MTFYKLKARLKKKNKTEECLRKLATIMLLHVYRTEMKRYYSYRYYSLSKSFISYLNFFVVFLENRKFVTTMQEIHKNITQQVLISLHYYDTKILSIYYGQLYMMQLNSG